jgi:hypothetical protein
MADQKGFLTASDRAFLRGEKKYNSKQGRYDRRRSIQERTQQAFRDFTLLYTKLEERERRKIFDVIAEGTYHPNLRADFEADPPESVEEAQAFRSGLFFTLAFMYLGLRPTDLSFQELVEAAVFQSERDEFDRLVDVTLTIEQKEIGPIGAIESAIDKLEAGEIDELEYKELSRLMEFIADPPRFEPASAREEALKRLDDLEGISLPSIGTRSPLR